MGKNFLMDFANVFCEIEPMRARVYGKVLLVIAGESEMEICKNSHADCSDSSEWKVCALYL